MNFKFGLKAFALSLFMLNPCHAARQIDKNLQNPRTVADTSNILQEMHGQMKLMQEQLGTLKASQQLLSAENAIKNLTPKVRKLEVHLERLEKQIALSATTDDFANLKNDIYDLKSRLTALINAPDTSTEAAINALNPTLDRMQKQVHFLYESLKSQAHKSEMELNERMELVKNRFSELELDLQTKLQELSGASSALNLVRQSLQQNHSMLNSLKVELETVKNEKIGQIFAELDYMKHQAKKDDLVNNINLLKTQFQNLASVFSNSLISVEQSHQFSEKSLQLAEETKLKMKEMQDAHDRQKMGLVSVYKKEKSLKEQLDLIKTLVEQNASELNSKFEQLEIKMPFDKLHKLVNAVKLGTKDALEQLTEIRKLQENEHNWASKKFQDVMVEFEPKIDSLSKSLVAIAEKTKHLDEAQLASYKTLKTFQDQLVDTTNAKFDAVDLKIADLKQMQPAVDKTAKAVAHLYQHAKNTQASFDKSLSELKMHNQEQQNLFAGRIQAINSQLEIVNQFKSSLEKNAKALSYLYKKSQQLATKDDMNSMKEAMSSMTQEKFNKISQGMIEERNHRLDLEKSIESCSSKIDHMSKTSVTQETVKNLSESVAQNRLKMAEIQGDLAQWQENLKSVGNYSLELKSALSKVHADIKSAYDDKIRKLNLRTEFLYKFVKEHDQSDDIGALKSKLTEMSAQMSEQMQKVAQASPEALQSHITGLESQVKELTKKLEEKDAYVEKLARRVNFLTKSLKEKLEQNQGHELAEIDKVKQEISEKMDRELKMIQKDRMVFETLIQRIAALEAAMSPETQSLKEKE